MSIYNELDQIIADYVGYKEEFEKDYLTYDCADPILYDNITDELRRYIDHPYPLEYMSKDARWCLNEWESQMNSQKAYQEGKLSI